MNGPYYTYVWRDAEGTPFYVGMGTRDRYRVMADRSDEFMAIYNSGVCSVDFVCHFNHADEAHQQEIALIDKYKRTQDGGTLVNKTAGGVGLLGYCHTEEVRAKMGEAISAAISGRPKSPAQVAAMSASRKGKRHTGDRIVKLKKRIHMSPPRAGAYKGVCYHKKNNKWTAQISIDYKLKYLGSFPTPEDAARSYDVAARELWGHDCYLNFRDEVAA